MEGKGGVSVLATFADFKTVKSRNVVQLVLEVPIEQANQALQRLGGVPTPGQESWVGVARVEENAARHETRSLAQYAGALCSQPNFRAFCDQIWPDHKPGAEQAVREWCEIDSRSELDTDPRARAKFEAMMQNFRAWCRQVIEKIPSNRR